jgi:hypothetical protein
VVVWQDVGQADRFSGSGVNGVMVAGGFFFGVVDRVRRGEKSWGEVGVEGGVVGCGEDGDGGEPLGVGIGDTSGVPVLGVGDGLLCGGGGC